MAIPLPTRLHDLAAELGCDLAGFERDGVPDYDELFAFLRKCATEERDEALDEITAHYDGIDNAIDDLEAQLFSAAPAHAYEAVSDGQPRIQRGAEHAE